MSVEGENLGVATIYLTVDKTSMDATIGKAKLQLAGMGAEASKQYDAMSASQQKMAQGLVRQAELINKTTAERIAYNAQLKIGGALGDEIARKALANAKAVDAAQNKAALSAAQLSEAQLLKANQSIAAYIAEADAARSAEAAQAEMAAAEDVRFKKIAADAMAEIEARQAITAATLEQARANAMLAGARGADVAGGASQAVGGLDAATVEQQIADYAALDAIMGKKVVTTEEVAAAEAALDRLQAAGMLSNEQLAESFAALDVATAAETKSLQANSVAQVENAAAARMNSRTQYELGIMLGEVASGNISRLKRSGAALANSTGFLKALMSPTGQSILGITAVLGTFAIAVLKGEEQVSALNTDLINTGDYAGATATELIAMGNQIDGTIGHARDAIQTLTSTGKFTKDQIGQLGQAVVDEMALTGKSVDQVVAEFVKLREDPIKASEQLNETEHYLTTTILQQIDALQKQGDMEDAARIATDARANALRERAQEMEQNLGDLQRVWNSLKSSASFAWDAMLGVGRPTSQLDALDQHYNDLLKERQAVADVAAGKDPGVFGTGYLPKSLRSMSTGTWFGLNGTGYNAQAQQFAASLLPALDAQVASARTADMAMQNAQSAADAAKQAATETQAAGQEGVETLDKLGISLDGYKNKQDKVNAAAEAFYKIHMAGGKLPAGLDFNGPFSDIPEGPTWDKIKNQLLHGTGHHADPAATALASLQSQVGALDTKSIGVSDNPELTKYVQGIAKLNDEFDKAIAKGADETKATAAFNAGVAALNLTLDKNTQKLQGQETAAIDGYKVALDKSNDALQRSINNQIAKVGMGDKEYQLQMQINDAYQQEAEALEKLEQQRETNTGTHGAAYADAVYQQDVANLRTATQQKVQIIQQGYAQMDAAQSNWVNGAIAAMQNWADQGANVAEQTKGLFTDTFTQMNDALVNFVTTGKLNFKSLVTSIISDLARMELRVLESKILQAIIGAFAGSAGVGGSGLDTYGDDQFNGLTGSGTYTGAGSTSLGGYAKGDVFNSPSLSRYSGGVYDTPHFFKFASGGVFGEAGPEAIMPLSRGPDGKLGIKASSAGGDITINVTTNVSDSGTNSQTTGDQHRSSARALSDQMRTVAIDVVNRARQPGGVLWKDRQGQAA